MSTILDPVTNHAIVRWLERVEGRDLVSARAAYEDMFGHAPNDGDLIAFLARYGAGDMAAIRTRILTPMVRAAIALGARTVKAKGVYPIIEDGRIVTVYETRDATPNRVRPCGSAVATGGR